MAPGRYELSEAQWPRIKDSFPGRVEHVGRTAAMTVFSSTERASRRRTHAWEFPRVLLARPSPRYQEVTAGSEDKFRAPAAYRYVLLIRQALRAVLEKPTRPGAKARPDPTPRPMSII